MRKKVKKYVNLAAYIALYIAIIVFSVVFKTPYIKIIASLLSITCTILLANGKLINFAFGVAYALLYGTICLTEKLYASMLLSYLVTFTAQILGFINWRKNMQKGTPRIRMLKNWQRVTMLIGIVIVVAVSTFVLKLLNSNNALFDSLTTVLFIVSMSLMVFAFIEEWIVNAFANIANIILWATMPGDGALENFPFLIMALIGVVMCVVGFINWIKIYKVQKEEKSVMQEEENSAADGVKQFK